MTGLTELASWTRRVQWRCGMKLHWHMWTVIFMWALAGGAFANCPNVSVAPLSQQATNQAHMTVREDFPRSYVRVSLTNALPGFSPTNGFHAGWCVEYIAQLSANIDYPVTIYDSSGPLPARLQSQNWDLVNYILNHRQGNADDVQRAIWHFIGGPVPPSDGRYGSNTPTTLAIIAEALANGEGFVPTQPGQVEAIILDPGAGIQVIVVEVPVGVNRPPVAGPDSVTTLRNVALSVPLSLLLTNDSDPDADALTVVSASGSSAQGGTAVLGGGNILYTPPAGFFGIDTFTYVVTDNKCGSATGLVLGRVTMTVTKPVADPHLLSVTI